MAKDKKLNPRFYGILVPGEDYVFICQLKAEAEWHLHSVIRKYILDCIALLKEGKSI